MKEAREKFGKFLSYVYGVGIYISLMVGAVSFFGYVAAFALGGQVAEEICVFIYKTVYPFIFRLSSISILIGLLKMYVMGEKALTPPKKKKI